MADKILHKRSGTPSAVPSAASLELGELALNTADGRAFMKKNDGAVVEIGANGSAFFSLVTVTATSAGQFSFTIPGGFTPGAVVVFLDGSSLAPAHYTATNGTTVVLASGTGVVAGSELVVLRLSAFEVADALPLGGTAEDASKLGGNAATEFYRRANILGTVSQSGGVPTGAVIERGSNANGEYVRYADGTQICWRTVTYTGPINTPFGSVYNGSVVAASSFPASFVDAPATAQLVRSITAGDPWLIGSNQRPTTNTQWGGFYVLNPLAISSTVTAVVSLAAIGRWY